MGYSHSFVSRDPWTSGDVACSSAAGIALAAAFRLASLRLRDCRCASAQVVQRVWPGMAVCLVQSRHLPSSLAFCRCSCASCRWYSLRSGVLFLAWSYSWRVSLVVSGSLALVAGGLFPSPLGFGLGSFFLACVVCLAPARGLRGSGKVCWNVILLEPCTGTAAGIPAAVRFVRVHPHMRGDSMPIGLRYMTTMGSPPHAWGQP